ncbi:MAG: exodeoxyribonuclease VII large subunit [Planctomycetota bacterium]|jgi:exodeoxyribonuclease VII large subunit
MAQEQFSFSAPDPSSSKEPSGESDAGDLRRTAGRGPARARKAVAPTQATKASKADVPKPPATKKTPEESPAFTVSQLTAEIEKRLSLLGRVRVEGEIAGLSRASSGHVYFDLKEAGSLISCVVWRGQAKRALPATFEDGMQVLVRGKLDVYAPHGRYKLIVDRVEPLGVGALLAQLEELKRELKEAGRLDRRRELPKFPRMIGVVTSRDGAALRDFLRTRSLRWPAYPLRLVHTLVQGPGADVAIADAIDRLDASGVDLIVVTRGGGSLQDLWCFNERSVADAIWRSSVPVVSAIGHESDTSLSDLVADFRAHTPTDAAQTVIPDRSILFERIARAGNRLVESAHDQINQREAMLSQLARSRGLADPAAMLRERSAALLESRSRLELSIRRRLEGSLERITRVRSAMERQSPAMRLASTVSRLQMLGEKLTVSCGNTLRQSQQRIELSARSLEAISPLAVLGRGYSITTRASETALNKGTGKSEILIDAESLAPGDLLETRLLHGRVISKTVEIVKAAKDTESK